MMKTRFYLVSSLLAAVFFAAGCQPRSAETSPEESVSEQSAQVTQPEPEPIPVTRSITDWVSAGAQFAENKDGTLKSADFSAVTDIPAFDPDDAEKFKTLRVLRGKGVVSDLMANEASYCGALSEFLWVDASISDKGLRSLSTLPGLKKLRLNGLKGTEETAFILAEFPALTDLDISGSAVTDADLAKLTALSSLLKLNLYQTQMSDAGLKALLPLAEQLEWLNLDDTQITDAAADDIAKFANLKFLHLGRTQVTDALVDSLAQLTNLEKIHITRTGMTEEGAARLRELLPNTEVVSAVEEKTE